MIYNLEVRKIKNEKDFYELKTELFKRSIIGNILEFGEYPATKSNISEHTSNDAVFKPLMNTKWNKHAEEMIMISEKFPKLTFELAIKEVYPNVFWKEYYHNGIVEVCRGEIVYEQPKKVQWTELLEF